MDMDTIQQVGLACQAKRDKMSESNVEETKSVLAPGAVLCGGVTSDDLMLQ